MEGPQVFSEEGFGGVSRMAPWSMPWRVEAQADRAQRSCFATQGTNVLW
jgi:hypothetical protein